MERVTDAYLERTKSLIEDAEEAELEQVHELGERLFFNPCGPTALFCARAGDWKKVRTSWTGKAVDPQEPAKLVRQLEATAMGCDWMLDRWEELRRT